MSIVSKLSKDGYINFLDCEHIHYICPKSIEQDLTLSKTLFERNGLVYEGETLPFIPIPFLMSDSYDKEIRQSLESLHAIIEKTLDLYDKHDEFRQYLYIDDRYHSLIKIPCLFRPHIHYCRFDFTVRPDRSIQVYEFNTASPVAMVFAETIGRSTSLSKIKENIEQRLNLKTLGYPIFNKAAFSRSILDFYYESNLGKPQIAIINSKHNTFNSELDAIKAQLQSIGIDVFRCYVEDLSYNGNELRYSGRKIDLCIIKFDEISDPSFEVVFSRHKNEADALLNAIKDGNVVTVNSLKSNYLAENKGLLALLRDEKFSSFYTQHERDLIHRLIPETKILANLKDSEVSEIRDKKDHFILKQTLASKGRGVFVGCEMTKTEWNECLDIAIAAPPSRYIAQEYVPSVSTNTANSKVIFEDNETIYSSLAYFMFRGKAKGMIIRTSNTKVTNVGKSGALQACNIVKLN